MSLLPTHLSNIYVQHVRKSFRIIQLSIIISNYRKYRFVLRTIIKDTILYMYSKVSTGRLNFNDFRLDNSKEIACTLYNSLA